MPGSLQKDTVFPMICFYLVCSESCFHSFLTFILHIKVFLWLVCKIREFFTFHININYIYTMEYLVFGYKKDPYSFKYESEVTHIISFAIAISDNIPHNVQCAVLISPSLSINFLWILQIVICYMKNKSLSMD